MNKNLLKLLFAILILSSCTVHKRLHQPGWDINFRGNWKMNQGKQVATSFDTLSIQKIDFQVDQKQSAIKNHSDSANPSLHSNSNENLKAIHTEQSENQTPQLRVFIAKQSNKNVLKEVKKLKSNTDTREASIIAWIFIILGLLVFIIGLSIHLSADATISGSIFSAVGIIGMTAGSILALIGLILLLTVLISKGVVKNEQRLKQQTKETEKATLEEPSNMENEEDTSEKPLEEEPLVTEKPGNKSKNWLIVGIAALVLSILFFVIKAN